MGQFEWIRSKRDRRPTRTQETRRQGYGSKEWRALARHTLMDFPLCRLCELEGRVSAATEVHHAVKWNAQNTPEKRSTLLLDGGNLVAVCRECHENVHYRPQNLTDAQRLWLAGLKAKVVGRWLMDGLVMQCPEDSNLNNT